MDTFDLFRWIGNNWGWAIDQADTGLARIVFASAILLMLGRGIYVVAKGFEGENPIEREKRDAQKVAIEAIVAPLRDGIEVSQNLTADLLKGWILQKQINGYKDELRNAKFYLDRYEADLENTEKADPFPIRAGFQDQFNHDKDACLHNIYSLGHTLLNHASFGFEFQEPRVRPTPRDENVEMSPEFFDPAKNFLFFEDHRLNIAKIRAGLEKVEDAIRSKESELERLNLEIESRGYARS